MRIARTLAITFVTLGAGNGLAADPTVSASPAPPGAQSFAQLDTNRDGQLSFSEAFAHPQLGNAFNSLDTNADGLLDRGEAAAAVR
jgi:hypothetical protein